MSHTAVVLYVAPFGSVRGNLDYTDFTQYHSSEEQVYSLLCIVKPLSEGLVREHYICPYLSSELCPVKAVLLSSVPSSTAALVLHLTRSRY